MGFIARVGHFTMLFRCAGPGNSYRGPGDSFAGVERGTERVTQHTYETVSFR